MTVLTQETDMIPTPIETAWQLAIAETIRMINAGQLTFPEPPDTPTRPDVSGHTVEWFDEPVRISSRCPKTDHIPLADLLAAAKRRRPAVRLYTPEKVKATA